MNSSLINVFSSIINVTNNGASSSNIDITSSYIQFNSSLSNLSTSLDNSTFTSFSVYPTNNDILINNKYICIEKYDYYELTEKWLLGIFLLKILFIIFLS